MYPRLARVRHVDVRQLALRELVHEAAVLLHPCARAQRLLVVGRHHRHLPRAVHRGPVADRQPRLPVRRAVEQPINVVRRPQLDAVDRKDVVTDINVNARRHQRRAQIRVPRLRVENARDLVAAVLDHEVRAKQPACACRHVGHVAAAHVGVADRDLRAHVVEQIVQIGAMVDVRQDLPVHLFHLVPVGAVHVRHVQVVALIAPALAEDLLELLLGFQIHAQRGREPAGARLRCRAIGIDDEQRGSGGGCRAAAAAAPAATTAARAAIEHLVRVGAHHVISDTRHERRRAPIARTGTAAASSCRRPPAFPDRRPYRVRRT